MEHEVYETPEGNFHHLFDILPHHSLQAKVYLHMLYYVLHPKTFCDNL